MFDVRTFGKQDRARRGFPYVLHGANVTAKAKDCAHKRRGQRNVGRCDRANVRTDTETRRDMGLIISLDTRGVWRSGVLHSERETRLAI